MTIFAILHPTGLAADELRQALEKRPELWSDLRLLTDDENEVGTLTEIRGAAAMVQRLEEGDLERASVAFFCGGMEANRPLLEQLPPSTTAIVLAPDATAADGRPIVAGVNTADAEVGGVLLSPHPGVVLLAHLLQPLLPLAPERAVATLMQPASMAGQQGLDELFEQTRSILAFSPQRPEAVFGRQLAFSYFPPRSAPPDLGRLTADSLGTAVPVTARVIQAGVFHGIAASLHLRFTAEVEAGAVREALAAHPLMELADDDRQPDPTDAAASESILVGAVEADPGEPKALWLWAVMDNLTVGGALNAVGIAEAVLAN